MGRRSRSAASLTSSELARLLEGDLEGDAEVRIAGVAEPERAGPGDLAFVRDARRARGVEAGAAGVVIAPPGCELPGARAVIRVANPYLAFARALEALYPAGHDAEGVHDSAVLAPDVVLGEGVSVGANAILAEGVHVGRDSEIGPGCSIGPGVRVGSECRLHANVTLYDGVVVGDRVILHSGVVIGADGFGYARDGRRQVKVPQVGSVIVEDDVEIGANACVDRGTFRATRIGRGTKIDNLVQIGHNCDIGEDCAISGLTGIAGSTVLESGVITGGHVGTAGHQRIGAGSMLAAMSGVHGDVPAGSVIGGAPHMEIGIWRRMVAALPRLPELMRRVRRLERDLERLDKE